jgi:hypothetical protein
VEKARGVIRQRYLYKVITYKEERKTFSERVRENKTRYASLGDQGKGDKIVTWETTEKVLMQSGTESGCSTRDIE